MMTIKNLNLKEIEDNLKSTNEELKNFNIVFPNVDLIVKITSEIKNLQSKFVVINVLNNPY